MQNVQTRRSSTDYKAGGARGASGNNKAGMNKRPLADVEGAETVLGHKSSVETKPNVRWQASHSNLAALHDKEQRYEAEHHHARHKLHRQVIPDYTSASTAMFSDCMFNIGPEKVRSVSTMNPSGLSPKHPFNMGEKFKGPFPQHTVASKTHDGGAIITDHFPSLRQLQPQQHPAHRHYKHNDKDGLKSPSQSFVKDKKRLVHRFLKSMEPTPSPQSKEPSKLASPFNPVLAEPKAKPKFKPNPKLSERAPRRHSHISSTDSNSQIDISLQSLLYHDLESSPKLQGSSSLLANNSNRSVVSKSKGLSSRDVTSSSSSSLHSSSSSSSSSSLSASLSQSLAVDILDPPGNDKFSNSNLSLNSDELDYYQRHIALQLQQTEILLKHNLKDVVLKDEAELTKNITNFDKIIEELKGLRSKTIGWKELIEEDYLMNLQQDFDKENAESFESRLTDTINTNVAKLQELEERMAFCKERLVARKETMRKMESLLSLESSLMISKKNLKFMYKYRNEALDLVSLVVIVVICYVFKHIIWH
ncbi:hypothetical protein SEUBUCD646_0A00490 [Saccharomyces eubayanus]|uniref:FRT2-like protein n=1 Tax=Saccharomyces eubayanus TaxID=1080349 RepID=A0ABN8VM20_SACEU|nr:hypothetical protein SEUBUCD650_0A00480 [Saccharomyces eubayanus]CAI1829757.1 hypothetical protein SEUBUCD646_0A00490 [Saccharomyces eubayanus]